MFTNEANLTYFRWRNYECSNLLTLITSNRSYTKKNCELECTSRTIEKECGCVLYYMPRFNENTKICSQNDAHCYAKIKLAVESSYNDTFSCQCMPGCFALSYVGEISSSKINVNGLVKNAVLKKYNSSFLRFLLVQCWLFISIVFYVIGTILPWLPYSTMII